jgi:hypothetical protein
MGSIHRYEVVIIGGGPAGLCAALYAGRGMLKTVLLERGVPGGELLNTEWIEDYPGFKKIKGRDLAQAMTEHAVQLANASEYGLQAAIFSRDVDAAMHLALALEVGTVQINGRTARGPDHFPFLGTKASGMGTQGVRFSIEAMTRLKATVFNMRPMDLTQLR